MTSSNINAGDVVSIDAVAQKEVVTFVPNTSGVGTTHSFCSSIVVCISQTDSLTFDNGI